MLAKKWEYKYKSIKREDIDFVSEKFSIPKVISTIILNRNIPVSDIEAYLSKSKKNIVNPFELLDMDAVYSYMKYTNAASCGVAIKNGMSFIEEYDDPVNTRTRVYAITREQWSLLRNAETERV